MKMEYFYEAGIKIITRDCPNAMNMIDFIRQIRFCPDDFKAENLSENLIHTIFTTNLNYIGRYHRPLYEIKELDLSDLSKSITFLHVNNEWKFETEEERRLQKLEIYGEKKPHETVKYYLRMLYCRWCTDPLQYIYGTISKEEKNVYYRKLDDEIIKRYEKPEKPRLERGEDKLCKVNLQARIRSDKYLGNGQINPAFYMESQKIFLNEKCLYPMNMIDFIKSIKFCRDDFDPANLSRETATAHTNSIFEKHVLNVPLFKRPLHIFCGEDPTQMITYYRVNNEWKRETEFQMTLNSVGFYGEDDPKDTLTYYFLMFNKDRWDYFDKNISGTNPLDKDDLIVKETIGYCCDNADFGVQ
jgi:hypothetical protein